MPQNTQKKAEETQKELDDMIQGQKGKKDESKDTSKKGKDIEDEPEDDEEDEDESEEDSDDEESEDDSDDEESEEEDEEDSEDDDDSEDDEEDESEDDDEESDEEDDSDDEDESKGDRSKRRKGKDGDEMIPKWKMKATIHSLKKDFKRRLAERGESSSAKSSKAVEKIVKQYGLNPKTGPSFVRDLIDVVARETGIHELKDRTASVVEKEGFEKDWNANSKIIEKYFPNAKPSEIATIKGKVHGLAYTRQYKSYSLGDIIKLNRGKLLSSKKKSFDSNNKTVTTRKTAASYDLDNPDSIPWDKLSMEDFEKVSNAMAKRTGSKNKVLRNGKPING